VSATSSFDGSVLMLYVIETWAQEVSDFVSVLTCRLLPFHVLGRSTYWRLAWHIWSPRFSR
jgi:hypothetical protein